MRNILSPILLKRRLTSLPGLHNNTSNSTKYLPSTASRCINTSSSSRNSNDNNSTVGFGGFKKVKATNKTSPYRQLLASLDRVQGSGRDKMVRNGVKHEKSLKRFTLDLGSNQIARIEYKTIGDDIIDMYHTEVPQEFRGKGLGGALAKGALEQARKENIKVKLTCSYLIDFVSKSNDLNIDDYLLVSSTKRNKLK